MTTPEKVAYLKGLIEGMELGSDSKEGKLFSLISDILEDLALDVEDIEENAHDLAEEIDELSDDLAEVEDIVYGEGDDEDDGPAGCYGCCRGPEDDYEDEYDEEDEDDEEPLFFDVTCPSCNKTITVDEDVINLGSIQCPNCGEMMEFDGEAEDEADESDSPDGEE